MHFIAGSQGCSEVHSWLHSITHSQPAPLSAFNCSWWHTPSLLYLHFQASSEHVSKYTRSMLPSTLLGMLSRILPIALDGILPVCLTVCCWESYEDTLKHTLEHALKYAPNCSRWHTPNLVDCALPNKLSRRCHVFSWACFQIHSQFHSMTHSQPAWLYDPKYTGATLQSTLSSMFSRTLLCNLYRMLPIALHNRFTACVTIRSQVHAEYAPKYSSEYILQFTPGDPVKDAPNCTQSHPPSLLDCTLHSLLAKPS